MNKIVKNYTHNSNLKQIVLTDYEYISLERISKIHNATTENTVFDSAKAFGSITVSGNVINYEWNDLAGFSDSDRLMIELHEVDYKGNSLVEEIQLTGEYRGKPAKVFQIMGRRSQFSNNTSHHDISDVITGTVFNPVVNTDALQVISSSASDTLLGAGIRQVRICYIGANNSLQTVTVNMNGNTAVSVPINANEILFMEAITVGSNTTAAGNITLRKTTGAVPLELITAGGNRSMSAKFMIPGGYTGYLLSADFSALNQTMDFKVRAQTSSYDRSFNEAFLFQENIFLAQNTNSGNKQISLYRYPELSKIKVSAISGGTGGNPRADCTLVLAIIKN